MTIQELASRTAEAMQTVGYAEHTALRHYIDTYVPAIRFFEKKGKAEYDPETMAEFTQWIEERAECNGCGRAWLISQLAGHFLEMPPECSMQVNCIRAFYQRSKQKSEQRLFSKRCSDFPFALQVSGQFSHTSL